MENLTGKRIIVTGATSGIGRCIALELAKKGALVACCGKSAEKLKSLQEEMQGAGVSVSFAKAFDLVDNSAIIAFVDEAREKLGGIDALVNCAGLNSARAAVEDIKHEDLEYMIRVNMMAPLTFIQQVIKDMKSQHYGKIVNILSSVCLFSNEGIGSYTASKAGFNALVKVLRKEVRKDNILISSIFPGGVDTPFRANQRPDYLRPEDVARAVLYVLTEDSHVSMDEMVLRPFVENNFS